MCGGYSVRDEGTPRHLVTHPAMAVLLAGAVIVGEGGGGEGASTAVTGVTVAGRGGGGRLQLGEDQQQKPRREVHCAGSGHWLTERNCRFPRTVQLGRGLRKAAKPLCAISVNT